MGKTVHTIGLAITLSTLLVSHAVFASFTPLTSFGENPGELTASYYQAATNDQNSENSLVVLLHGCVQNGERFAEESGFLTLAKQHQFNLLIPQQQASNNVQSCFNWFSPQDISKDKGELQSLKHMILAAKATTQSTHVYIAGLSAGGAMANVLLATYPELFNGGAIIAGIPYPCADSLTKAISCMRSGPSQPADHLAQDVLQLHKKSLVNLPPLTIWTGNADKVVNPKNSQYLAKQWAQLNQQPLSVDKTNAGGFKRTHWLTHDDKVHIELIELEKIGHGMMVTPNKPGGGNAGDYLLTSPISAAIGSVKFWNLTTERQ